MEQAGWRLFEIRFPASVSTRSVHIRVVRVPAHFQKYQVYLIIVIHFIFHIQNFDCNL